MSRLSEKLSQGIRVARAKVLGDKVPLVVSIVVTNRCNYSCGYCDRWDGRGRQLTTAELSLILDDMGRLGTRRVIFTGGEPLIRKDLPELIERAKGLGMAVNLNSNGVLVPRHLETLEHVSTLTISVDGDRTVHDGVRGLGAFDAAIAAVRAARALPRLRVRLTAVISRLSIGAEDALLDVARAEGVEVFFQPAESNLLGSPGPNPLSAPVERYRETIDHLVAEKRGGAPIANSVSGLQYLRGWPNAPALPCAGSFIFCRLDHDGRVMICGRMGEYEESFSALELGFAEAFRRLSPARCPTCWCASRVEVNQAWSLQPDAIAGLFGA